MATTTGHWRWLPTPLGADDRLELDAPGGSDVLQTIASNATHAARQNNLSTLWEHPGGDVWTDLYALLGDDPADALQWWKEDGDGVFARYLGAHRIRPHGEASTWPTIELRARAVAPSTYTTGLVLVARPVPGRPSSADLHASVTTTSTTLTDVSLSLALDASRLGSEDIVCATPGATTPPAERGTLSLVHLYLGAWCTSGPGLSKGSLSGLTVFLKAP